MYNFELARALEDILVTAVDHKPISIDPALHRYLFLSIRVASMEKNLRDLRSKNIIVGMIQGVKRDYVKRTSSERSKHKSRQCFVFIHTYTNYLAQIKYL
jgi:hypothetical protein